MTTSKTFELIERLRAARAGDTVEIPIDQLYSGWVTILTLPSPDVPDDVKVIQLSLLREMLSGNDEQLAEHLLQLAMSLREDVNDAEAAVGVPVPGSSDLN